MDAIDGPIRADGHDRLYGLVAERYGCDDEYARQVLNRLENDSIIVVERRGQVPAGYDIHPRILRRTDCAWTPTDMLAAVRSHASPDGTISRERYDALPEASLPPSDTIAEVFHSWDRAVAAAGLRPT